MNKIIVIELETTDSETFTDVLTVLETTLPYMADNVTVTSRDGGIGEPQS